MLNLPSSTRLFLTNLKLINQILEIAKNKIWLGRFALLFVIIHFGFIIAYALPSQLSNPQIKSFAQPYVEPVFTQTWSMFAPCPEINGYIEVKYFFNSDSTDWVSPAENARNKHKWYRGSYHGELVLAESNLLFWIGLDLDQMDIEIGDSFPFERSSEFQKGYSFYKIKNYLKGNCIYLYDKMANKARIRLVMENVITHKSGIIELPQFYF